MRLPSFFYARQNFPDHGIPDVVSEVRRKDQKLFTIRYGSRFPASEGAALSRDSTFRTI